MSWVVVPNLVEGRDQLNERFPNREKGAEGFIGDNAHKGSPSSHNSDETGNPEFNDHDGKDEVRAWDADKDLNDSSGVTMEQVVQLWVTLARSGVLWWIRYIIFNGRIWHRRDGFITRVYTGSNKHTDHAHINSDFTQAADTVTGTNWHLGDLGKPSSPPANSGSSSHVVKQGAKGDEVRHIQQFFHDVFPAYRFDVNVKHGQNISVDGDFGPQTSAWVKEFQRRVHIGVDGEVGPITFGKMRGFGYKY